MTLPYGLQALQGGAPRDIGFSNSLSDVYDNRRNLVQAGLFCDQNTRIELRAWNSNVNVTRLTLRLAMLLLNGEVLFTDFYLNVNAARVETNAQFNQGIGYLLSAMVFEDPAKSIRGQTFVVCDVYDIKTNFHSVHLMSNYVHEPFHPCWPYTELVSSVDGHGIIRSITGTNPALGANSSETVPTNARWRLICMRYIFVTSATVSTRTMQIRLATGSGNPFLFFSVQDQIASLTYNYYFWYGVENKFSASVNTVITPISDTWLDRGGVIDSLVNNEQVTDGFTSVTYMVEEWIQAQ